MCHQLDKGLDFERDLRIPYKFSRESIWDKAIKKDLTVNNPEEDKDQDLASEVEVDKCIQSRNCMRHSRSSISESERLQRKLKFQEKGPAEPRIEEIGIFLSVTTLNSLGYWDPKG